MIAVDVLARKPEEFVVVRAQHLAERLTAEHPTDESARLEAAFARALGLPATETELAAARSFLESQKRVYGDEAAGQQRAWQDLCQMLLASNAFLYLE